MAFVNVETMNLSREEKKKYNDLYASAHSGNGSVKGLEWTIDRDREILLVCKYKERQDMYEGDFDLSYWLFYWHGEWIEFVQKKFSGVWVTDDHLKLARKIIKIDIPLAMAHLKEEIFHDIKDAFQVFRVAGAIETRNYQFDLTLDVSEV